MRVLYLSRMPAAKAQLSLHIRAVSPHPSLLALKKRSDLDEGSYPTAHSKAVVLLLLIHSLMFLQLDLCGLRVWSLFCYASLSVLSCFAIILTRKREYDA